MEERTISINNLKVNYKIAGSGPAILILHGWGSSSDSWIQVQEILAQEGCKVIVPDLPGFGRTFTPKELWGVKDYSNFVLNFAEKLNLSNFFLVGHSFGGRISIKIAAEHSEKLKSLILCGSAGVKSKPGPKTRIISYLAGIGNIIFSIKPLLRLKNYARNLFYLFLRHKDYVKADKTMKEIIKKVLEEDLLSLLSGIKTKTLLIWGKNDRMVPLKYAHIFKENIRNSELIIIPEAGHSPHLETPEKLSEIIVHFLES